MPIVLLCTSTVGYQVRAFGEAARRAGITIRIVSECCDRLTGRWRDGAVPARFDRDPRHVAQVMAALAGAPVDGVTAVGNRPAWLAAHIAQARGLPWHHPDAVVSATHTLQARGRMLAAGLPVPWFLSVPLHGDDDLERLTRVRFPCVIAPVGLSEGCGVIRVASLPELLAARGRLARLLARGDVKASAATDDPTLIVEALVPGQAFALDGVLEQGALRVFALFEKPEPLDGPLLEETMDVTPARLAPARQQVIAGHIARAALALGLHHGPIHAECRVDGQDIVVLEVAPRAIAGPRARAVPVIAPDGTRCGLEDALLAHALGRPLDGFGHQAIASGVLMVPVPEGARLRVTAAMDDMRALPSVTGLEWNTARPTRLEPLGEDERHPCFVFAEAADPDRVIESLRAASRRLHRLMDGPWPTSEDQA